MGEYRKGIWGLFKLGLCFTTKPQVCFCFRLWATSAVEAVATLLPHRQKYPPLEKQHFDKLQDGEKKALVIYIIV